nr:hypothetical protein [uncultured Blautia sp.]
MEDRNAKTAAGTDHTGGSRGYTAGCTGCNQVLKIKIKKEPDKWGIISSASTLAFISVFDAMAFLAMEENGYTKEEFYLIHTGGGVGEILRKEGL